MMERGREEQGLMEGGESGGGLMEGRECRGWGMSPCVRGEAGTSSVVVPRWHPVVVARRLLIACRLLFACRLPVACRVLFACRLPITCCLSLSSGPVKVVVLGVCGFSWCRAPLAIRGWWCGTSLCRGRVVRGRRRRPWGGRSPFPSAHASAGLVCYPTVVLGLQTRSVRWGG